MRPVVSLEGRGGAWGPPWVENALVALLYWGLGHLTYVAFRQMGVLPMPVWPPAALAIVAAFYRGWRIAPGIAVGALCINHFCLGGTWTYAGGIALTNTLGPLAGAAIMRWRVSPRIVIAGMADLLVCFFAVLLVPPMITATGGMGFKWLLGLVPASEVPVGWLKWAIAHSMGALLFAPPVFAWLTLKEPLE